MITLLLTLELIARLLAGECGPMGTPCQVLVASTVQERLEAGIFGDTLAEVLEDGYYGDAPVTAGSLAVAYALVTGRVPSLGYRYVYSAEDRARYGWDEGDGNLRRNGWVIYVARDAPGGSQ